MPTDPVPPDTLLTEFATMPEEELRERVAGLVHEIRRLWHALDAVLAASTPKEKT